MLLPGADAFSEGLEIEEAEREPGVTGDLLSFYLNEEKWDRLARWDEENRSIYLYLSSGSYITDNSFNLFQGTAAPVSVWQKDEEECFIAEALYAMQADGRPGLTLTFNEKIAEGSLSTQSVRSIRILREKTGTSPFLDFDFDVEIASKSSSQFLITVPDEKHVELVTWQTEPLYLLVREASLCRDYSGNSCRVLSTAQALIVPFQNDVISPEIAWYLPTSTSIVKVGDLQILVKFGEKLLETSWPGALNVYEYKDSMGDSVLLKSVAGTLDYDDGEFLLSFVADEKLQNGYTYLVVISTGIRDISANAILQPFEWEVTVLRDFTTDNVVYYPQENVRVEISSGALSGDGKVEIRNSSAEEKVTLASSKEPQLDGFVDGASPPMREKTLGIYWLDEEKLTWLRLPGSAVNAQKNEVRAQIPHFSVYALFGGPDYELSESHPYPVPYVKGDDTKSQGIIFSRLPSRCVISVYTLTGAILREMEYSDVTAVIPGILSWDVRNTEGAEIVNGIYYYLIESGGNRKKGKLVVVR